MEVSWDSAEAWERAAVEVRRQGKRSTVGPICRDCLRLIPRHQEGRVELYDAMCKCGHYTTKENDADAHGIVIRNLPTYQHQRLYE